MVTMEGKKGIQSQRLKTPPLTLRAVLESEHQTARQALTTSFLPSLPNTEVALLPATSTCFQLNMRGGGVVQI